MDWTSDFAYCVGLLATDGNLSKDGRHIDLTSKDIEQLENFQKTICPKIKISEKKSGNGGTCPHIQFSDAKLYRFLLTIGLHPKKSKTISEIILPDLFFADFIRGCFDGDGCSYSYWDKRWKSSFMLYISFSSASINFLEWIESKIYNLFGIHGKIKGKKYLLQLMYAKSASVLLSQKMYYSASVVCLKRKRFKLESALSIINKQARVEKLVYSLP